MAKTLKAVKLEQFGSGDGGGNFFLKAVTSLAGILGIGRVKISTASQAYERIPIVRRAVKLLAESVAEVPYYVTALAPDAPANEPEGGEPPVGAVDAAAGEATLEWPFVNDLPALLKETMMAFLIEGAAYWLKLGNAVGVNNALQWLNPTTVTPDYAGRDSTNRVLIRFTQSGVDRPQAFTSDQIVYFREFTLEDDVKPGVSAVENILEAAATRYYMAKFGRNTFENGAMPVVLVTAEGNPDKDEVKRVENFFQRMASGVQNAMRYLGLAGNWKTQIVSPPLDELAMPELSDFTLQEVALGLGIPESMLSNAANFATAQEHDAQFWRSTIGGWCKFLAGVINEQLLHPAGVHLEFAIEEVNALQRDENERATALSALRSTGMPLDLAMQILGYDLPKGWTYEALAAKLDANRQQMADSLAGAQQRDQAAQPADGGGDPMKAALETWERFAVKRLRTGRSLREFNTTDVPATLKAAVEGALAAATDPAEVRRIFKDAALWHQYP